MNVLAADIGGTQTRFAILELGSAREMRVEARRTYPSEELTGIADGLRRFDDEVGIRPVDLASIAVAGPVENGEARLTNRGWHVREGDLAELIGTTEVHLLNDFEALGHAIPILAEHNRFVVHEGAVDPEGVIVLLGAGTGLGQSLVVPDRSGVAVEVHPTEGGHASFAPRSEEEWSLQRYLTRRHGRASWEHVLSGAGLHAIYDFLVESGGFARREETRAAMSDGDPAAVVSDLGLGGGDPACARAIEIFVAAYGARAGDVALSCGATGGVYLAGGVARRIGERFADQSFLDPFLDKGSMRPWLEKIPVRLITSDDAGIFGAVVGALRHDLHADR